MAIDTVEKDSGNQLDFEKIRYTLNKVLFQTVQGYRDLFAQHSDILFEQPKDYTEITNKYNSKLDKQVDYRGNILNHFESDILEIFNQDTSKLDSDSLVLATEEIINRCTDSRSMDSLLHQFSQYKKDYVVNKCSRIIGDLAVYEKCIRNGNVDQKIKFENLVVQHYSQLFQFFYLEVKNLVDDFEVTEFKKTKRRRKNL
jgi:hypothetical protein